MSAQQQAEPRPEAIAPVATTDAALAQLAEKADQAAGVIRLATVPPLLSLVRGLFNEVGIQKRTAELDAAVRALHDGPDLVAHAREALLAAQERERQLREQYETALAEAEWALDGRFVQDGNKTFLVVWHRGGETTPSEAEARGWKRVDDGGAVADPDVNVVWEERRQMTADERRAWTKRTAQEAREVMPLAGDVRGAEHAVALAKVDVERAEDRWNAARYALEAARTQLGTAATQLDCLAHAARGHNGSEG